MDYSNIYLQIDSRQQANKHDLKDKYFQEKGIKTLKSKLPFGDYALINDTSLVIDTKKDMLELENCLTKDHIRFRNEITNANSFGIGIIILIEEKVQYKNLDDVANRYEIPKWKSNAYAMEDGKWTCKHRKGQPMGQFKVDTLVKAMKTMQQKYAVIFAFTTPEKCGEVIIDILVNNREKLNKYFISKLKEIKEV